MLEQLTSILITERDLKRLTKRSLSLYRETFSSMFVAFIVWDNESIYFHDHIGQYGGDLDSKKMLTLSRKYSHHVNLLSLADQAELPRDQQIELLISLRSGGKTVGTMLFGPKNNGRNYSNEDMQLLRISAGNLGVAVANALKYSHIQSFAHTLKNEVELATKSLRSANEKLKNLSETKDEFMSIATHQVRPQLSAARGFVEVLGHTKVDDEQKDLLEWAGAAIERSIRIVTDMLNLSRFSSGTFQISKTVTDLVKLVSNELASLRPLIKASQTEIINLTKLKSASALVDEPKLREVIANICSNAIQYSPNNSRVEVRLYDDIENWNIEVRDYGIGVDKKDVTKIFRKYYRSDKAKDVRASGSGVGLFLAKTVIEGHGGKLYYRRPKDGVGSVFGFAIPKDYSVA